MHVLHCIVLNKHFSVSVLNARSKIFLQEKINRGDDDFAKRIRYFVNVVWEKQILCLQYSFERRTLLSTRLLQQISILTKVKPFYCIITAKASDPVTVCVSKSKLLIDGNCVHN